MANSPLSRHWLLDPAVDFLNHGSFGACPRVVLENQREWADRLERGPVRFLARELEQHLDHVRAELGAFLDCHPDDLALVSNASAGLNTVLRSMQIEPGDELVVTNHEYNASANTLDFVARRAGARLVVVEIPFPIDDPRAVCDLVLAAVTDRTRLVLIDHVTSQTGLVMPIEPLVRELRERGVETMVDGAHGPGMVPLELDALGAAYYTGNLHKWVCAPKGAAFLHVRRDLQSTVRPLTISHGANSLRTDRSAFRIEADWIGTLDPSPWLAIPASLDFVRTVVPGGLHGLREHNRDLARGARAGARVDDRVPGERPPAAFVGRAGGQRVLRGSAASRTRRTGDRGPDDVLAEAACSPDPDQRSGLQPPTAVRAARRSAGRDPLGAVRSRGVSEE
ncbi:MAG: aminotransferase class V-fold PLP-dependent enzyme [Planctomycetota bacterium]|jgi:isopenicillin-N epimerase